MLSAWQQGHFVIPALAFFSKIRPQQDADTGSNGIFFVVGQVKILNGRSTEITSGESDPSSNLESSERICANIVTMQGDTA